jgi:hypothetical protein
MRVHVKATSFLPEFFGDVVGMPTPNVYNVKTDKGVFTIHHEEIIRIYYV